MNVVMDIIENRRSIRSFTDNKISIDILNRIISAGLYAPSPKNRQPWSYIAITDKKMICEIASQMYNQAKELSDLKKERKDIIQSFDTFKVIKQCSVLLLVCYKNDTIIVHDDGVDWNMSARDIEALELMAIGASVENMLLRAQELGISSLWCGDVLYAYETLKRYSSYPVVSAICFGYSDDQPSKPKRKEINEVCTMI